ncbi:MAG: MFS transporter [Alphaproteobacteria bacterium]|nr:MFS transporter [Alphaproteobacteria bacterium]MBU1516800.1 MFS transporter [Alphaproteobacteria bacterium]MBU2092494.1 MFS transporter [Alphaproteobacteria bacterium]MBU2152375.1 MFS transporter [Alphaproteobacteria bacterium]MBU2305586.1 MFS transporter [Alphaproteobacteria bacterium]
MTISTTPAAGRKALPRHWALGLLLAISTCAFIDRSILNTIGQAIKDDLGLTDLQLGLLGGAAFSILYGLLGVPVARLAERRDRVKIIAAAVTIWSLMTALCGFTATFGQLLLARVGVGIGEAGANAPAQAYLADQYPPGRRASVIGVLGLATPIGIVLGGIGGAWLAQHYGWRTAFFAVGLPGLLLAILALATLRDPRPKIVAGAASDVPPFGAVLKTLLASRAFRHILAAGVITNFIGQAVLAFGHPFFVRAFGLSYTEAAVIFALMNSVSVAGGFLTGGFLVDHLVKRDVRFYGWTPGLFMWIAMPFYALGFLQTELIPALILLTIPGLFSATYYAPSLAVTQNLVSGRMRATAVSVVVLAFNLIGLLFGPLVAGALSDAFAARAFDAPDYGVACKGAAALASAACQTASAAGVRYALISVSLLFLWSGAHFMLSARHLKRDLDLAQQRSEAA